jgi:uncharacterized protein (DUF2147 family)
LKQLSKSFPGSILQIGLSAGRIARCPSHGRAILICGPVCAHCRLTMAKGGDFMLGRAILVAAAVAIAAPAFATDPILGLWRTNQYANGDSGLVEIKPCGSELCGTLVKTYKPSGEEFASRNLGKQIISDTTASGAGTYEGKIFAPGRDQTFTSKLELSGDTLDVYGCAMGVCRNGGTWTRVE